MSAINIAAALAAYGSYGTYGRSYGYGSTYLLQWVLLIGAFVVTLIASSSMKSTFSKYARIPSSAGITGEMAAHTFLQHAGLGGMPVLAGSGELTDHYDPSQKTVTLSASTYGRMSVASIAVAAHECGHAIQDATGYAPLRTRTALVPVTNIASTLSWPLIVAGLFFSLRPLATVGVFLFTAVVLFQLVTLPVEFDASRRGLRLMEETGIVTAEELAGSRKVLTAAAMTYVAALASSVMTLIRLLLVTQRRK